MSLRAFHLLFIALSVILAAFFAAWAVEQYRSVHQVSYIDHWRAPQKNTISPGSVAPDGELVNIELPPLK